MGRALVVAAVLAALSVPRPGGAVAQTADSTAAREVIAVTERFFEALAERDTTALTALMHPAAQVVSVGPEGRVDSEPVAAWIRGVGTWRGPELRDVLLGRDPVFWIQNPTVIGVSSPRRRSRSRRSRPHRRNPVLAAQARRRRRASPRQRPRMR